MPGLKINVPRDDLYNVLRRKLMSIATYMDDYSMYFTEQEREHLCRYIESKKYILSEGDNINQIQNNNVQIQDDNTQIQNNNVQTTNDLQIQNNNVQTTNNLQNMHKNKQRTETSIEVHPEY
jgi:hypothetical protein